MSKAKVQAVLISKFKEVHVENALKYYEGAVAKFHTREWDRVAQDLGRFVEAITKAILDYGSIQTSESDRQFKATTELRRLENYKSQFPETLRMVVPKALIFIAELANNRLGRHYTSLDPHEMDATAVRPLASWVLAELVHFCSQEVDKDAAMNLIRSLTTKTEPFFEIIDGRTYVHKGHELKAQEISLLLLYRAFPARIARDELVKAVKRHGFAHSSSYNAIGKIRRLVDVSDDGLLLLAEGRQSAESLLDKISKEKSA